MISLLSFSLLMLSSTLVRAEPPPCEITDNECENSAEYAEWEAKEKAAKEKADKIAEYQNGGPTRAPETPDPDVLKQACSFGDADACGKLNELERSQQELDNGDESDNLPTGDDIPIPTKRPDNSPVTKPIARGGGGGGKPADATTLEKGDPKKTAKPGTDDTVRGKSETKNLKENQKSAERRAGRERGIETREDREARQKRESEEAERRAKMFERLNKDVADWLKPKKDDLKKKPEHERSGSLEPPSSGGGGASPNFDQGGSPSGGMKGFAGRPMKPLERSVSQLAQIPGAAQAVTSAGAYIRGGKVIGTEAELIEAQRNLAGMPLQAMMEHPGILNKVGRPMYERVVATVKRGDGGKDAKDIKTEHNSLVWEKSCTKGLENCNSHMTGTSYSAGKSVPAPSVSSIYDSLFGDDSFDNDDVLETAHAKLEKKSLGASVWDRIKSAFSGLGGDDSEAPSGTSYEPRHASVIASSVRRAPGSRKPPVKMTMLGNRSSLDSSVPRRLDLLDSEKGGLSVRKLVWGVSGGLGFGILLTWAFRKRRETDGDLFG